MIEEAIEDVRMGRTVAVRKADDRAQASGSL
jgi:hypothetical protein